MYFCFCNSLQISLKFFFSFSLSLFQVYFHIKKKKSWFPQFLPTKFFFSHFITIFLSFQRGIVGHKNLNKVPMPCVVSMAEESIIVPRRSHARTVRPRPWHVTRESHTIKKKFRRRGQPWHDWRDGGHSHI